MATVPVAALPVQRAGEAAKYRLGLGGKAKDTWAGLVWLHPLKKAPRKAEGLFNLCSP